jgi:hypothetical protein
VTFGHEPGLSSPGLASRKVIGGMSFASPDVASSSVVGVASIPASDVDAMASPSLPAGQEAPGPTHTLPEQQVQPVAQGHGRSVSDTVPTQAKRVIERANERLETRVFIFRERSAEGDWTDQNDPP